MPNSVDDCLIFCCMSRPEQFSDTTSTSAKTQDSIPDDMLPPSDAESDASDTDDVSPICNPNRQELIYEADNTENIDSNSSDDSDAEQK